MKSLIEGSRSLGEVESLKTHHFAEGKKWFLERILAALGADFEWWRPWRMMKKNGYPKWSHSDLMGCYSDLMEFYSDSMGCTKNDGKIHHFWWEKSRHFDWAIFNSYVKLQEGNVVKTMTKPSHLGMAEMATISPIYPIHLWRWLGNVYHWFNHINRILRKKTCRWTTAISISHHFPSDSTNHLGRHPSMSCEIAPHFRRWVSVSWETAM